MNNIKAGILNRVVNTERLTFSNAKTWYTALWVEDSNGGNERCVLITIAELSGFRLRAKKNSEDWVSTTDDSALKLDDAKVKLGRIITVYNKKRKHWKACKTYNAISIKESLDSDEECLLLTDRELQRIEYRASRNEEDVPSKSFWTDLFD